MNIYYLQLWIEVGDYIESETGEIYARNKDEAIMNGYYLMDNVVDVELL